MKNRNQNIEYTRLAIAAAILRSEGRTQEEIAVRLNLSQSEVSRMLAFAVEQKYLSRGPALLRGNIEEEDYRASLRQYLFQNDLQEKLRPLIPRGLFFEARVVPATMDEFPFEAAGRVVDLIPKARRIGIMWGRTIKRMVQGVLARRDALAALKALRIECIPLCGDPLFLMNSRMVPYSASQLAADLGPAINPSLADGLPCLIGVPAYISRKAVQQGGPDGLGWKRFLEGIPGYREIFGASDSNAKPLMAGVDTIITGAGRIVLGEPRIDNRTSDLITERLKQEDLTEAELDKLIYGDIGGLLIEKPDLSPAERDIVADLNRGWTGIQAKLLKQVAQRAKPNGSPGVILVAAGKGKRDMVREIVRLGLVNQLIVDSQLDKALQAN